MHIVHVICMLSAHVHIIFLSSLTLFSYTLFPQVSFRTYCLHTCTLSISCVYCTDAYVVHLISTHLHMYMSSAYYLSICILCAHYLQWSLIYSFLTDNADVIHMSSLVLFIYPIMYNLVSAHCLHKCTLSMSTHMYTSFACHLYHFSYTLLSTTCFCTLSTHMHIVNVICILFSDAYVMYMLSLLLLSVYLHVIYILSGHICIMCTLSAVVLDMFLPNRQYQCHPYIISSTLYIFYYGEYVICTPSG